MSKIKDRIYNDFFRPSKEKEYEKILATAKDMGYEFHTMLSFEEIIHNGVEAGKKYLILRRDIDTADFKILEKMLQLEVKYNARATYYFRWSTLNIPLMMKITKYGGEASYHYEEIATYSYRHRLRSADAVRQSMTSIRKLFVENLKKFRKATGLPCVTVASHGDYVNTKLQIQSKELMCDSIREECGILREAYDKEHFKLLTCRIADQVEVNNFTNKALEAIERGEPVLELLTHPRQWNSPIWVNFKENLFRVLKGLYMNL